MTYPSWSAGQRITTALLNEMTASEVTPALNQTVNNSTTFVNTDIVVPVLANARYKFSLWAAFSGSATARIKFRWTEPANGGAVDRYGQGPGLAATGGSGAFTELTSIRETAPTSIVSAVATNTVYIEEGIITAGTTNSSAVLQFAQNVATAADTIFSSASRCWFQRVG